MEFSKLGVAKFVASAIVGVGTGKIISKIVKDHVTPETIVDKIAVTAAVWALGGVVGEATKTYTNNMIDETVGAVAGVVNQFKESAKLDRISRGESTYEKEGLDPEDYVQDPISKKISKIQPEEGEVITSTNTPNQPTPTIFNSTTS